MARRGGVKGVKGYKDANGGGGKATTPYVFLTVAVRNGAAATGWSVPEVSGFGYLKRVLR